MARLNHVASFRGTTKTESGNLTCGRCGEPIRKGDSYRWWKNKTSRGGIRHNRCMKPDCKPMPWEYQTTSPHIAGLMQAEHYGQEAVSKVPLDVNSIVEDLTQAVQGVGENVREVAEGYRESAENMESGFGHETEQSMELNDRADELESQADELESWDPSDDEPPEEVDEREGWMDSLIEEASEAISTGTEMPY